MIVSVDADTQADGSDLAKKVESETETANGEEVEGIITAETCATATGCPGAANPVTSIAITTQKFQHRQRYCAGYRDNGQRADLRSTKFLVHSNISGTFPAFNANTIGKAQRVEVDSENEAGNTSTSVSASKIKLLEQGVTGTISALSWQQLHTYAGPDVSFRFADRSNHHRRTRRGCTAQERDSGEQHRRKSSRTAVL